MSKDKNSLLAARIARAAQRASNRVIPERSPSAPVRLTAAQKVLWFLQESDPSDTAYNVLRCFRFETALDREALHAALQIVCNRHEALRTSIINREGIPEPHIATEAQIALREITVEDTEHGRATDEPDAALAACTSFAREPFDLAAAPLIRALIAHSEQYHYLVISVHHIACDEWSLELLIKELATCYASFISGSEPQLQPVSLRFSDYSGWLAERLDNFGADDALQESTQYWKQKLSASETPDLLPVQAGDPKSKRGGLLSAALNNAGSDRVRAFAHSRSVTVFQFSLLLL